MGLLPLHGLAQVPRRAHGGPVRARIPRALPAARRHLRVHPHDPRQALRRGPQVPQRDLHHPHQRPPFTRPVLRKRPGHAPRRSLHRRAALRRRGHQLWMPAENRKARAVRSLSHGRLDHRARSDTQTRPKPQRASHGEDTRVRRPGDECQVREDGGGGGGSARRRARSNPRAETRRRRPSQLGVHRGDQEGPTRAGAGERGYTDAGGGGCVFGGDGRGRRAVGGAAAREPESVFKSSDVRTDRSVATAAGGGRRELRAASRVPRDHADTPNAASHGQRARAQHGRVLAEGVYGSARLAQQNAALGDDG